MTTAEAEAEALALHGETASLVVGQAQSSGTVHRAEDTVLFEQVVNDRLLVSSDPGREQQEEEGKRGGCWSMAGACLSGGRRSTGARLGICAVRLG